MRPRLILLALAAGLALVGCGGGTTLLKSPATTITVGTPARAPQAAHKLGFPAVATKNTTRVAGGDPTADAAAVALAVYPSAATGTHPGVVTLATQDDWQAAIASAVTISIGNPAAFAAASKPGCAALSATTASTVVASGLPACATTSAST